MAVRVAGFHLTGFHSKSRTVFFQTSGIIELRDNISLHAGPVPSHQCNTVFPSLPNLFIYSFALTYYRHTIEILWLWFQTTTIKQIFQSDKSNECFGFPRHIEVMLRLSCGLLNMQKHNV